MFEKKNNWRFARIALILVLLVRSLQFKEQRRITKQLPCGLAELLQPPQVKVL